MLAPWSSALVAAVARRVRADAFDDDAGALRMALQHSIDA
jgi:hypothetical protein